MNLTWQKRWNSERAAHRAAGPQRILPAEQRRACRSGPPVLGAPRMPKCRPEPWRRSPQGVQRNSATLSNFVGKLPSSLLCEEEEDGPLVRGQAHLRRLAGLGARVVWCLEPQSSCGVRGCVPAPPSSRFPQTGASRKALQADCVNPSPLPPVF